MFSESTNAINDLMLCNLLPSARANPVLKFTKKDVRKRFITFSYASELFAFVVYLRVFLEVLN